MSHGDAARKDTLIEYGFRLPCAKDNRPLKWEEFFAKVGQKIYISATPSDFEKNTLKVVLRYQHTTLKEAVVKSTLPVTRMENHALVTRIKGTILENLGSARDVLGRLPGIMVEQDAISVFGKGTPAIYINGQLVRNDNMLNQLQSTKIKQVELITNPGAKYDATVSSVIRITAERSPGEGFSFDNRTKIGVQDYIYLSEQMDMNYRYNNLDIFTLLEYKNGKTEGLSANIQNSWLTQHFMQDLSKNSQTDLKINPAD